MMIARGSHSTLLLSRACLLASSRPRADAIITWATLYPPTKYIRCLALFVVVVATASTAALVLFAGLYFSEIEQLMDGWKFERSHTPTFVSKMRGCRTGARIMIRARRCVSGVDATAERRRVTPDVSRPPARRGFMPPWLPGSVVIAVIIIASFRTRYDWGHATLHSAVFQSQSVIHWPELSFGISGQRLIKWCSIIVVEISHRFCQ